MYPEELNNGNFNVTVNIAGGRRGNPNALRPPPPYSRPPPYARPPPPYSRPTSEELLFDDVFREKAVALRSVMTDFLLVQPFYKFDTEFQSFLTRVKRLTAEGQRSVAAAAAVRDANAAAALAATAAANNLTVDAARSAVTAANRSERPPPPPYVFGLTGSNSHGQRPSVDQPGTSASAGLSTNRVSLAALNLDGDKANNGSSSSASRPTNPIQSGSSSTKINEKYLSKWSVDVMTLDLACSVAVMKLSGTLLAEDKVTVLEETHDAGMIESRKGKNIIKTIDGLYHLIGPIYSGFSNDFYHACVENNGFPKNWRNFLIQLANVEETNDETTNADSSMTRNGTNYKNGSPKSNEKKLSKQTLAKQKVVMQQLSQASTSKTIEQFTSCKTPSQFLKYQFHRKLVKACKIVTNQFK